jgi:hypothetical protein
MSDTELLELAAKAAGYKHHWHSDGLLIDEQCGPWNPLTDDGDALRLAVKLNLSMRFDSVPDGVGVFVYGEWDGAPGGANETYEDDGLAAVRRAIVQAAAEIGEEMS